MKNTAQMSKILIVDDDPSNILLLRDMLSENGYTVRTENSGKAAVDAVKLEYPDLVLLDVAMPEMNGYEVCEALQTLADFGKTPIIFISAGDEIKQVVKAFHVGGVDYITKPFQIEVVLARVRHHLNLHHQRKELARLYAKEQAYVERLKAYLPALIDHTSHDIRNPISNTNLIVSLLEHHGRADDEKGKEYLERIRADMKRINDLLIDLMKVAGFEIKSPTLPNLPKKND